MVQQGRNKSVSAYVIVSLFANFFSQLTGVLFRSFDAAGPVVTWNSNGIWSVPMQPVDIPHGQYNVTYKMKFMSIEPSKNVSNLTSGSSVFNVVSFHVESTTTLAGRLDVSNLTVSKGP